MIFNCPRCGSNGELRKGPKTGNNKAAYVAMKDELKTSFLKLRKVPKLCPACLQELRNWAQPVPKQHRS